MHACRASVDPGRRVTRVWSVEATTNAIVELADQLASERIERVVVESTSDYWRSFCVSAPGSRVDRVACERK